MAEQVFYTRAMVWACDIERGHGSDGHGCVCRYTSDTKSSDIKQ